MNKVVQEFNDLQLDTDKAICDLLANVIDNNLSYTENKIWYGHPVWFINGNPIVGYDKLKSCIRLMFWSGQSFDEEMLLADGSFKAASIRVTSEDQINSEDLIRCLAKSEIIQWDYKNIVKRKGELIRL